MIELAARNALKLGASLLGTWGVALGVRLLLPRLLGPERFGALSFVDTLTATLFVLLTFGTDTYIRKEVARRHRHAGEFLGGLLALRLALCLLLLAGLGLLLAATDRPREVWLAAYGFGLGQLFFVQNGSLAALLHARGRVDGLSAINVGAKLAWGVGAVGAVALGLGLVGIGGVFLLSEASRTALLWRLARRHLALTWRLDLRATLGVLGASAPFFVILLSQTICGKLAASVLAFAAPDAEVGWFSAAHTLAQTALLMTPLIDWVLLPYLSHAAGGSEVELTGKVRRAAELVLAASVPLSLLLGLGADVWVRLLFGPEFGPAAWALRLVAPMFVLTYLCMVNAAYLTVLGRAWAVTAVSIGTMVVSPLLLVTLVPLLQRSWGGPGGAGAGAAMAMLFTEVGAAVALLGAVKARCFGRGSAWRVAKQLLAAAAVIAIDRSLLGLGALRLAVDAAAYFGLVLALKAAPLADIAHLARAAFQRSRLGLGGAL